MKLHHNLMSSPEIEGHFSAKQERKSEEKNKKGGRTDSDWEKKPEPGQGRMGIASHQCQERQDTSISLSAGETGEKLTGWEKRQKIQPRLNLYEKKRGKGQKANIVPGTAMTSEKKSEGLKGLKRKVNNVDVYRPK